MDAYRLQDKATVGNSVSPHAGRRRPAIRVQKGGRRRADGYTLTEMLVVIAIIGLISAVVIPQTIGQLGKAQSKAAKLEMQTLSAAVEVFSADNGRLPTQEEGLQVLLKAPGDADGWDGPYVRTTDQLIDPWGQPYAYEIGGDNGFSLRSLGADKKPGGNGANKDLAS